jgi:hypothetical protein
VATGSVNQQQDPKDTLACGFSKLPAQLETPTLPDVSVQDDQDRKHLAEPIKDAVNPVLLEAGDRGIEPHQPLTHVSRELHAARSDQNPGTIGVPWCVGSQRGIRPFQQIDFSAQMGRPTVQDGVGVSTPDRIG